jgi:hypothetical protein
MFALPSLIRILRGCVTPFFLFLPFDRGWRGMHNGVPCYEDVRERIIRHARPRLTLFWSVGGEMSKKFLVLDEISSSSSTRSTLSVRLCSSTATYPIASHTNLFSKLAVSGGLNSPGLKSKKEKDRDEEGFECGSCSFGYRVSSATILSHCCKYCWK